MEREGRMERGRERRKGGGRERRREWGRKTKVKIKLPLGYSTMAKESTS